MHALMLPALGYTTTVPRKLGFPGHGRGAEVVLTYIGDKSNRLLCCIEKTNE